MTIFGPERPAHSREQEWRELFEAESQEHLKRDLYRHLAEVRSERQDILRLARDNVLLHNIFSLWLNGGATWERCVSEAIKALVEQNTSLLKTAQKQFMLQPAAVMALRCPKCGFMPSSCDIPGVTPAPGTTARSDESRSRADGEIVCLGHIPGISDREEE